MNIEKFIAARAAVIDADLSRRIKKIPDCHPKLREAMLYSVSAGGKRLRPVLLTAAYELFGGNWRRALPAACALEMVHTYSLIHDDLPAMDDDSMRRGRLTNHIVFGEALAVLAGDALLTNAFSVLHGAGSPGGIDSGRVLEAAGILARRAGAGGRVSGQAADLEAEGFLAGKRQPAPSRRAKAARLLSYIHRHKTADLIIASVEMGAVLAGAGAGDRKALVEFAAAAGLCFQITDDILDVVGDKKKLGKSGSDERNAKLTYASLYGVGPSRAKAAALLARAREKLRALSVPPERLEALEGIAAFVYGREK